MQRAKRLVALALLQKPPDPTLTDTDETPVTSGSEYCPTEESENSIIESSSPEPNESFSSEPSPIVETTFVNLTNVYTLDSNQCLQNKENSPPEINSGPEKNELQQSIPAKIQKLERKTGRIRRKHFCLYCDVEVGNFSRHLERHHSDEFHVQEFMALEKNSKKRKKLIDKLRREGDFTTSKIIPVMKINNEPPENYIVCKFCNGYYNRKALRRHAKRCFFNPDPSQPFRAQIEGHTIMAGRFGPKDILRTSGLLNMLRADSIGLVAKKDPIICEVARRYLKSHKDKHLIIVAKRYMRRLARLLIGVRNIQNNENLRIIDILTPDKFRFLVQSTQIGAEYDDKNRVFKSPSFALQMGTLIKHTINTAYSLEVQKEHPSIERMEKLKSLTTLIETDWAHEVSSEAGQNLTTNKFNKPTLIPLAKDIKKFEQYLNTLITNAKHSLIDNSSNIPAYRKLVEGIFCNVLIFNKRRVGELQRMTLLSFMNNRDATTSSEFEKVLSESEKILFKTLKRVVIRGKRGRGVPVLFDKFAVESLEFLINSRTNFDLTNNPYLFGVPGSDNPLIGNVAMRKHAKIALGDVKKASLLTSTRLRKHLATITQIFKMDRTELEQLATFMGHTEKTHSEFYRLPDDVYQTAKISKLLLLSKKDGLEKYKGKLLKDIDIDDNVIEDSVSEEEEDNNEIITPEQEENNEVDKVPHQDDAPSTSSGTINLKIKKGCKRTLVPWTAEQKQLAEEFFKTHLRKRLAPKKNEVIKLIEKYPVIFSNKTWPVIKVYICNKFKK